MPQKKFYAVRVGYNTGIFTTPSECDEQVKGFSGAQFAGFSNKEDAEVFMETGAGKKSRYYAVINGDQTGVYHKWYGPGGAADASNGTLTPTKGFGSLAEAKVHLLNKGIDVARIQIFGSHFAQHLSNNEFEPDFTAPFNQEFQRFAKFKGIPFGSQEYRKERTAAIDNDLRTQFTQGLPDSQNSEEENQLRIFQAVCEEVGKTVHDSVEQCLRELKNGLPYINIINLLDCRRTGGKTGLEKFYDKADFIEYTKRPGNMVNLQYAKEDGILRALLQDLSSGGNAQQRAGLSRVQTGRIEKPQSSRRRHQFRDPHQPRQKPASPQPEAFGQTPSPGQLDEHTTTVPLHPQTQHFRQTQTPDRPISSRQAQTRRQALLSTWLIKPEDKEVRIKEEIEDKVIY
ncbi:hypothetical protein P154DRAFT_527873 [Amniculicola lignicola CBS 123094]|uniref:ribonuclease H n=1 Tax=Amniculicola lignicola CBS 123094 TaxID=1392246 RepID=A0A6A5VZH1_9PLEO|nr:hypothetical protein P154DRAFT_527873 [Amniculicola lignicola CBS 123094]